MSKVLKLTREDPVIHLKAYGGVQIRGVEQAEMNCEIDSSELATLVEENGHVYVTINAGCSLTVPSISQHSRNREGYGVDQDQQYPKRYPDRKSAG